MNRHDYHVPRTLNAPPMLFIFEADSAMVWGVWILLGAIMGMPLMGLMMAEVFRRLYGKLKNEGGRGLIMRLLYWYTPLNLGNGINSEIREFTG